MEAEVLETMLSKERRSNPSTLIFCLHEITDFFSFIEKTGVQAKRQDKFKRRDIMRQCQFCKLCNITFFKRWVSYGVILFVSTILTTISAALAIYRVIIKNGSMNELHEKKGNHGMWFSGEKQTNNEKSRPFSRWQLDCHYKNLFRFKFAFLSGLKWPIPRRFNKQSSSNCLIGFI